MSRSSIAADLSSPLLGLPGVGPRTAERLAARGLLTRADLLDFVPRRWDDLRALTPLALLVPGVPQTTRGEVTSSRFMFGRRRSLEVRFAGEDGAGRLVARWFFARSSMKERFAPGTRFVIAGLPREHRGELVMAHPETRRIDEEAAGAEGAGVRARYPEIEGVKGPVVAAVARRVAEAHAREVVDGVPPGLLRSRGWPARGEALALLHGVGAGGAGPAPEEIAALNRGAHPAQRRLAWDELFFLQLGLARRRAALAREPATACVPVSEPMREPMSEPMREIGGAAAEHATSRFLAALPFLPTDAQRRAMVEIGADLARPRPMHRLLEGDVGSGKTVVMYAAAELAMAAGRQVAVMAPTEILAEQHARTLAPWARATGRRMALLTASTARAAREQALAGLAAREPAGRIDLVVGTHALLGERVRFASLGLVIVDEQHRFGVAQRGALREKGAGAMPHLLVMTATPIPRTLALTAWGDLDITVLDEMPPGWRVPETRLAAGRRGREQAYRALARALDQGRQGYVVCPRVDASEIGDDGDPDAGSAVATHERLARELPGVAIGLVHGRLPAPERDAVMRAFAGGAIQLLVATTVIEVGVDVPAAEVMLIEGAERFGLAQLHQLRGRIGRPSAEREAAGGARPLCLLVTGAPADSEGGRRLAVLVGSSDGFAIAEADLALRGPGELFGTRQAGLPRLRFADLARDLDLLHDARHEAFALLDADPDLSRPEHAITRVVLEARWREGERVGELRVG